MASFYRLPYPATGYPTEGYPGGDGGDPPRQFLPENANRWTRVMGPASINLYSSSSTTPEFPRTVMHDVTISRGRTGSWGSYETQQVQVTFTGVADPTLMVGRPISVAVDSSTYTTKRGISYWSITNDLATRCKTWITDLDRTVNKDGSFTTKVTATGAMALASRCYLYFNNTQNAEASQVWNTVLSLARNATGYLGTDSVTTPTMGSYGTGWVGPIPSQQRNILETLELSCRPFFNAIAETRLAKFKPLPEIGRVRGSAITLNADTIEPVGSWSNRISDSINSIRLTGTNAEGSSILVASVGAADSINEIGRYELAHDTAPGAQFSDNYHALSLMARAVVESRKWGTWAPCKLRIDMLRRLERGDTGAVTRTLGLEVGSQLVVQGIAPRYPFTRNAAGAVALWVEGIEEHLSADEWTVTLSVSNDALH